MAPDNIPSMPTSRAHQAATEDIPPSVASWTDPLALIIVMPNTGSVRVAGLTPAARFERALYLEGTTHKYVKPMDLAGALASLERATTVFDGDSVFEHDPIHRILSTPCESDEVILFFAEGFGTSPAIRIGSEAAQSIANALDVASSGINDLVERARGFGIPIRIVTLDGAPFWRKVRDRKHARMVTSEMLARLRLRPGGLIARAINRHVSIRITRLLLWTPITPNQITTIAGLIALVASWLMLRPGFEWGVTGAALMQFSSIIDGCDGEVARLRYQFSEFGKWYDSAVDEVVNALFIAATGYHLSLIDWPGWLWVGVFAAVVNYVYGMINFHCKWRTGFGIYWWFDLGNRPNGPVQPTVTQIGQGNFWGEFKTLFGRDAYLLFFLLAAVAGGLHLPLALLGVISAVVTVLLFLHIAVFRAPW